MARLIGTTRCLITFGGSHNIEACDLQDMLTGGLWDSRKASPNRTMKRLKVPTRHMSSCCSCAIYLNDNKIYVPKCNPKALTVLVRCSTLSRLQAPMSMVCSWQRVQTLVQVLRTILQSALSSKILGHHRLWLIFWHSRPWRHRLTHQC